MSKTYSVAIPISGVIYVDVQADDEESAIDAALESDDLTLANVSSWDSHRQIVRGNVCYAELNRAEAELISDDAEAA